MMRPSGNTTLSAGTFSRHRPVANCVSPEARVAAIPPKVAWAAAPGSTKKNRPLRYRSVAYIKGFLEHRWDQLHDTFFSRSAILSRIVS